MYIFSSMLWVQLWLSMQIDCLEYFVWPVKWDVDLCSRTSSFWRSPRSANSAAVSIQCHSSCIEL